MVAKTHPLALPGELQPFAARLFNRFPEVLLSLGHPSLGKDFDLPPADNSFSIIEETGEYKLVQVLLGRRGSTAAAAENLLAILRALPSVRSAGTNAPKCVPEVSGSSVPSSPCSQSSERRSSFGSATKAAGGSTASMATPWSAAPTGGKVDCGILDGGSDAGGPARPRLGSVFCRSEAPLPAGSEKQPLVRLPPQAAGPSDRQLPSRSEPEAPTAVAHSSREGAGGKGQPPLAHKVLAAHAVHAAQAPNFGHAARELHDQQDHRRAQDAREMRQAQWAQEEVHQDSHLLVQQRQASRLSMPEGEAPLQIPGHARRLPVDACQDSGHSGTSWRPKSASSPPPQPQPISLRQEDILLANSADHRQQVRLVPETPVTHQRPLTDKAEPSSPSKSRRCKSSDDIKDLAQRSPPCAEPESPRSPWSYDPWAKEPEYPRTWTDPSDGQNSLTFSLSTEDNMGKSNPSNESLGSPLQTGALPTYFHNALQPEGA